jgi:hypothetical protein
MNNSKEDFSSYLIKMYPELFPKDKDGNPRSPDCGIWCPVGWEDLVEDLCKAINTYCCLQLIYTEKRKPLRLAKEWFYKNIFSKIYDPLHKKYNPYNKPEYKQPLLTVSARAVLNEKYKREFAIVEKLQKVRKIFYPYYKWHTDPVTPVTIDQIKEKFGQLRFYYEGGDTKIAGMVSFAEYLSSTICQNTGNRATLCKRGSWYATLSPEEAAKKGFTSASYETETTQ